MVSLVMFTVDIGMAEEWWSGLIGFVQFVCSKSASVVALRNKGDTCVLECSACQRGRKYCGGQMRRSVKGPINLGARLPETI